ncbi:DUF3662 and FHA domain-containing protein [Kocuria rhizophila]|uniref:DUF2662 domain-containing protein n=1 Tax=Kocuria rhizophila TaxID=72000 RepID=A0AAX2SBN8_KOCRH|nr:MULTISPECIES: DUF3662 and FHA domain-containing protein [Kocuria]WIW67772.1 DUF3662 and FHA domain-containing protein [Kocuria sp. ChxB]KUP27249.1 hypothetical protein IX41_07725 [Kocuria rhizophila]MBO4144039.1 DUF3662 and FHA domain-containing protein [Kocuria rhizophila]MCG7423802.1 DUF3662 and FHA domain-containing protein [Kocuria rhizophila]MCT1879630.1 DUF3662 and FHA domain-containing protein [Kocuria rhizophila]
MGFWTGLENGIEKAVRTAFTAGSRKRVEAVEIASALRRELDQESFGVSGGRTMAPNVFTVEFSDDDFPRAQEWGVQLAEELCDVVIRHARSQAYTLQGAVRVSFVREPELETGEFRILSSFERTSTPQAPADAGTSARAPQPPAPAPHAQGYAAPGHDDAAPVPPAPEPVVPRSAPNAVPVIEVGSERFSLNAPSVSVGRSAEADITVEDTGVSRKHLEIRRQGQNYLAVDLGSTNGSSVDGQRIQGRAQLVDGSVITMGRTRLVFRLLVPKERR